MKPLNSNSLASSLVAILVFTTVAAGRAAEPLQGAATLLKQAADQTNAPLPVKQPSKAFLLRADLTNFNARAATLAPVNAAREWLALADRFTKTPQQFDPTAEDDTMPLQPTELIQVLPPPAAWDALTSAIEARPAPAALKDAPEFALRLLTHTLSGNHAAQAKDLASFETVLAKGNRRQAVYLAQQFMQINDAFLRLSDDTNAVLAGVERQLAAAEKTERGYGNSSLQLPDLVALAGPEKAEALLRRALLSNAQQFRINGEATLKSARRLALLLLPEMKQPRWSLAQSTDTLELFEAMEKKFTKPPAPNATPGALPSAIAELADFRGGGDYERRRARAYYLLGLIVANRTPEAVALARKIAEDEGDASLPHDAVLALERAGHAQALDEFLFSLLTASPELPYWPDYFALAAKTGRTGRMLQLARAAAARPALAGRKGVTIRDSLYKALLAADQVEEGVKELRALITAQRENTNTVARRYGGRSYSHEEPTNPGLTLARLGQLLDHKDWLEEGIIAARAALPTNTVQEVGFRSGNALGELADFLQGTDRAAAAEQLLAAELARQSRPPTQQQNVYYGPTGTDETLKALARLYHRAGRHVDVLLLLEQAPQWGAKDLAELFNGGMEEEEFARFTGQNVPGGDSLDYYAAAALLAQGRKGEARAIVDAILDRDNGYDPAYELLLQLEGQGAISRLDALFARDPFEERPLIWKALLLHQAGKNEEAEKIARQAITIDPSDGEQGPGRRMRVYAVLADIRAARGDAKEAEFFRGVIRAIRQSERADAFYHAGLLSRAVAMYQDSLKHFADAYCIQSRLALRMTDLGKHELAAQYYQRAFELMPDSFGRVESHCFGCEHTFDSPQAQTLAERVFTTLAAKNPDKPQIHYLLGYLREQQGRPADALPHLRQAVKLDPDYLNAWSHLEDSGRIARMPTVEREAIALNILRLDPLGRHTRANLNDIVNLRVLWVAAETAWKIQPAVPASLLPLPASRRALEVKEREAKVQPRGRFGYREQTSSGSQRGQALKPGDMIIQQELVLALSGLLDPNRFGFMEE